MDSDEYDAIMGAGSSPVWSPPADPPTTSRAREGSSRSSPTSGNPPAQTPTPSRLTTSGSTSRRKRANSHTGLDTDDQSPTNGPPLKRLRLEEDVTQYYAQIVSGSKLKSPGSLHSLKTFLEAPPGLQHGLLYGAILSLNEREGTNDDSKGWEVSVDLNKNIRAYGGAMILAPGLGAYKINATKSLLGLLHKHSLAGLPSQADRAKAKTISGRCSVVLGEWRAFLKQKLVESMGNADGQQPKDIGELCDELVKGTDIVITVQHHARIAWLRTLLRTKKIRDNNKFWDEVDACLRSLRKDNDGDEVKISKAFSKALKADCGKYGKATTTVAVGTPDWQKSIETTATSLVPFKRA